MRKVAEPLRLTQSQVNNVGTLLDYPLDGALLHWCKGVTAWLGNGLGMMRGLLEFNALAIGIHGPPAPWNSGDFCPETPTLLGQSVGINRAAILCRLLRLHYTILL